MSYYIQYIHTYINDIRYMLFIQRRFGNTSLELNLQSIKENKSWWNNMQRNWLNVQRDIDCTDCICRSTFHTCLILLTVYATSFHLTEGISFCLNAIESVLVELNAFHCHTYSYFITYFMYMLIQPVNDFAFTYKNSLQNSEYWNL